LLKGERAINHINSAIEIYKGKIKLIKDEVEIEVDGIIEQFYNNNKYIYLSGTVNDAPFETGLDFLGKYNFSFDNHSGEAYINRKRGSEISGKVLRDITNNYSGNLNRVNVEFLNLVSLGEGVIERGRKSYLGKSKLEYGDWLIELNKQENYKEIEQELKLHGGYAITHIAIIRKVDDDYFEVNELESILSSLIDFLNFVHGRRIGISVIEGFLEEIAVYNRFDNKNITPWNNTKNWYPDSSYEDYLDIFGSFTKLFEKELWSERKNYIMGTYLDCFSEQTIEVKIIMIQTFLELISYIYLVQSDILPSSKLKSNRKFKNAPTFQNIQELFEKLEIPLVDANNYLIKNTGVENSCGNETADSIKFFIKMRNQIIHPRKSSLFNNRNLRTAYYIGIWMIDMVMLRLLGYNERYWNRLSDNKWTGDVENGGSYYWVPWSENENITKNINGFINPN